MRNGGPSRSTQHDNLPFRREMHSKALFCDRDDHRARRIIPYLLSKAKPLALKECLAMSEPRHCERVAVTKAAPGDDGSRNDDEYEQAAEYNPAAAP
jgi:hypothetical protein